MPEKKAKHIILDVTWISLLFLFVLLINLQYTPSLWEMGPDSGLFAYAGKSILNGGVPYRDFWDHKPPLVFYWNALGQQIFGQNVWGIWWFTTFWLGTTASLFYLVLRKLFKPISAIVGSLIFLIAVMSPTIYQGGNLTEVYALLPQVLIIASLWQYFRTDKGLWAAIIGALAGICLLTKQPSIGLSAAAFLAIFYTGLIGEKVKTVLSHLALFMSGAALILLAAAALMGQAGVFGEFWDANFSHSIAYVGEGGFSPGTFLRTIKIIFYDFPLGAIALAASLSLVFFIALNFKWLLPPKVRKPGWKETLPDPRSQTLLAIFLALPMEVMLASLGGRNFGHYFITAVPAFVTAAISLPELIYQVYTTTPGKSKKWLLVLTGLLALLGCIWTYQAAIQVFPKSSELAQLDNLTNTGYQPNDLEKYIIENTGPEDYVFVWHNHPRINFNTDRPSPTRYLFATFLMLSTPEEGSRFQNLLDELKQNKPVLILMQEPNSVGLPSLAAPDPGDCPNCTPEVVKGMNALREWVNANYSPQAEIYDWVIFGLVK